MSTKQLLFSEEESKSREAKYVAQNSAVIIENVRRAKAEQNNSNIGYNVLTGMYVDLLQTGIVDPAKVTRGALDNAASIAAMILTTEALVTDMPKKNGRTPSSMPDMSDMDY